MVVEVKSPKV